MNQNIEDKVKKFEKGDCEENKVFYQAMEEVIYSIAPLLESDEKYARHAILDRLVVPDRIIKFKVTWMDDKQQIQVNTGWAIQRWTAFSSKCK